MICLIIAGAVILHFVVAGEFDNDNDYKNKMWAVSLSFVIGGTSKYLQYFSDMLMFLIVLFCVVGVSKSRRLIKAKIWKEYERRVAEANNPKAKAKIALGAV